MSSEPEEVKERLLQAAKTFFFHVKDLVFFINKFTDLFNYNMNTQILSMTMKEDSNIKDLFEQLLNNFKEMKSVVDAKRSETPVEPFCCKVATAVRRAVEKCAKAELPHSAKELLQNIETPVIVSMLESSNLLGSLESLLSLLMTFSITNLQLSDFYREDTKEQSEATTSDKVTTPRLSKTTKMDTLKKLLAILKIENDSNPIASTADRLEHMVKAVAPVLQTLQNTIKTVEAGISPSKKVSDK
ncbi:uncharacterized protein C12orf60 homolog [Ctenodactylus gundi]